MGGVSAGLVAGALAGLALPPLGLPPLLWLALVPLWSFAAAEGGQRRPAIGAAAIWGGLAVLVSHRWLLALHPLDWIGVPMALSLPLCWLLLLFCAAAGALLVATWVALAQRLHGARPSSALLMSGLWGLVEVALAKGPLFWIGLGGAALPGDRALAGLASWGGAGLLAAVQLAIGWCLWQLWRAGPGGRRKWASISALVVLVAHGLGAWALAAIPLVGPATEKVLVVQPAIPTRQKFQAAEQALLDRRLALGLEEGRRLGVDAVLLPEGAMGVDPLLAEPAPVQLISGGFRWQERGRQWEQRSSLLRFEPGESRAGAALDKHRLVPLGEWVPLGGLLRWSGLSAVGGLEPGEPSRLLPRPQGAIGAAICYELSDGSALAAATREGARWLLVSANLDPYPPLLQAQFEALAQLRAIETGRALVSVANTGPSGLVNARGLVVTRLPVNGAATGLVKVPQLSALTPYDRWGEMPLLALTLLAGLWRVNRTGVARGDRPRGEP
ncbi:apolipoprotein N-acyltransferase [Cyanobium sp. WAJ14-Wanaka]|uniref:apolipoprotein N-acyltransferase n=1 Tax=Cyanobium sp. WAJ14-Wanaka TaxID=2823725 RepID=UPI0020CC8FBC|nr:apolipoprotein N-acyltransferase [Cyanobium sp. WAJ14-Wanaka]MCP9775139.1 apolipoprotein N-acyltransferase [Cyanobium sp. WAJ14-Wanaka]